MILDEIIEKRKMQLRREKQLLPPETLRKRLKDFHMPVRDFAGALKQGDPAIIAEVKKASPSKGVIKASFDPVGMARAYEAGGADAISVLTEEHYFLGKNEYLTKIKEAVPLPVLRKDFIIDPYQIEHARLLGADAVLFIAAILTEQKLTEFIALAKSLGLHALVEAHDEEELDRAIKAGAQIIGINNRNLKTFQVDLGTTVKLSGLIPAGCTLVSESGIATHEDILTLKKCGADAVLIGETLIKSGRPGEMIRMLRNGI